mmetsp:Transcript_49477/g.152660  ORF Transcript_49477/g.152660 Transcript_49477/m.152660 type:complete len:375 (-) Transcript_49477:47-1171(-)
MGLSCSAPLSNTNAELLESLSRENSCNAATSHSSADPFKQSWLISECSRQGLVCHGVWHLGPDGFRARNALEEVALGAEMERGRQDSSDLSPKSRDIMMPPYLPQQASIPEIPTGASKAAVYGDPLSPEKAAAFLPMGGGGITWVATIVGDEWKGPDVDADGEIRPRRPNLPVRASDFESSLVETKDGRWVFSGVLNGWPGLQCLELRAISLPPRSFLPSALGGGGVGGAGKGGKPAWQSDYSGGKGPPLPTGASTVQATLRMAPWTAHGWSRDSPGFVWWYFAQNLGGPVFSFGEDIHHTLRTYLELADKPMPEAVRAHVFAHRYALGGRKEDKRKRITYHAAILLEWDHGQYCTVVELGPLNGISARFGRHL